MPLRAHLQGNIERWCGDWRPRRRPFRSGLTPQRTQFVARSILALPLYPRVLSSSRLVSPQAQPALSIGGTVSAKPSANRNRPRAERDDGDGDGGGRRRRPVLRAGALPVPRAVAGARAGARRAAGAGRRGPAPLLPLREPRRHEAGDRGAPRRRRRRRRRRARLPPGAVPTLRAVEERVRYDDRSQACVRACCLFLLIIIPRSSSMTVFDLFVSSECARSIGIGYYVFFFFFSFFWKTNIYRMHCHS